MCMRIHTRDERPFPEGALNKLVIVVNITANQALCFKKPCLSYYPSVTVTAVSLLAPVAAMAVNDGRHLQVTSLDVE